MTKTNSPMEKIILGILLIFQVLCVGQNAQVPNFDQSADAATLGKSGYFPISYYSGQPDISLPVHTLNTNGVSMDLNLQYDASGIAVDRHPGWVGQNWSLNGGGAITRTVNGFEDERGLLFSNIHYNVNISFFDFAIFPDNNFTLPETDTYEELREFSLSRTISVQSVPLIIDTEPDMFHFKVGNISGRFYFGDDDQFKVVSDHNVKVEFDISNSDNYQFPIFEDILGQTGKKFHKVIKGFKLIDDAGNKYTFGYNNNAIEYTYPFFRQYSFQNNQFFGYNNWVANTWHLTKVEDIKGEIIYSLEYERSFFTGQLYENLSSQRTECKDGNDWDLLSQSKSPSASGSLLSPVYLTKIENNKDEEIIFKRSVAEQLEYTWSPLFGQETIDVENELGNYIPGPDIIPYPYLQTEDYNSYNPVAAMTNPIKGLKWNKLDSIIVTQKGHRVKAIKLTYNNVTTERLNLLSVENLATGNASGSTIAPIKHVMTYNEFSSLPEYLSHNIDHFGYYNSTNEYVPSDPVNGYYNFTDLATNYYPTRQSSHPELLIGQLTQMSYPTGGHSTFEYEWHDYARILSNNRQTLTNESGNVGGLRIKKISHYDGISVTPTTTKRYFYKRNFQNGGTSSSGILSFKPSYVFINWLSPTTSYPTGGMRQSSFSRNILAPLVNQFENPVNYSEVVEMSDDDSYTIYKFTSYEDVKDDLPYATLALSYSPYMRFQEKNFCRGRLLTKTSYSNLNIPVQKIQNHYASNLYNSSGTTEYNLSINAFYNVGCFPTNYEFNYNGNAIKIYNFKPYVDSTVTKHYFGTDSISLKETYTYDFPLVSGNKYKFLSSTSVLNSDGKTHLSQYAYTYNHVPALSAQIPILTQMKNAHRYNRVYETKKVNNVLVDGMDYEFSYFSGVPLVSKVLRYEATWDASNVISGSWDEQFTNNAYNTTFLTPTQVTKKGWQTENYTLSATAKVLSWTYNDWVKSWQFYDNDILSRFDDLDGTYAQYTLDNFKRFRTVTLQPRNVITENTYHYSTSPTDRSFIKTKTKYPLTANSAIDSIVNYNYADGLGRPIQTIDKYGAPDGTTDVIGKIEYDNVGRQYRSYEPIPVNSNNGNFYTGTFTGGYTQQLYELNPPDRPRQTTPPAWQTTNHSYGTNTAALTNPEGQVYPARSLMITTTTDPDGKSLDIYSDKIGRKILQRRRQSTNTNDTWTVYDDKNRPIREYPPSTSTATPGLIYEYRYDGDNNMIYKKVPDAGAEQYRYDSRKLPVAMRNARLQTPNRWLVTHYDQYGRPTKRGYYNGSEPMPAAMPTIHTLLEEYFYDGFNGSSTITAPIYKGKLRKKRIKALNDISTNTIWTESEYTYDIYGRVSQENTLNHLGDAEINTYTYDFADNMLSNLHFLFGANGVNHLNTHTYDHRGRKIFDRHNLNGNGDVTTSQCNYDHKSQLIERNLGRHATTGTHQYLQSLDYTYNPQGWLTGINTLFTDLLPFGTDPCAGEIESYNEPPVPLTTDEQDLFALGLDFNTTLSGSGIPASQNGNITALKWWHRNSGQYNQSYTYRYDYLNRVTEAKHGEIKQGVHTLKNQYNEKFDYDPRGNITKLDRRGMVQRPDLNEQCYRPMTIDSLTYVYVDGTNKLIHVIDNAPCMDTITLPAVIDRDVNYAAGQLIRIKSTDVLCNVNMNLTAGTEIRIIDTLHLPNSCGTPAIVIAYQGPCPLDKYTEGFNQQSIDGQYGHDSGGNMIYDPNKKLLFTYNHLNLPYLIVSAENEELFMLYNADGTLLQRKYVKNNVEISKIDYLRGKEIKNGLMEAIYFSDGRILKEGTSWKYEYNIKDHLGNVRVTFSDDNNNGLIAVAELRSRNDYYAFGMEWNNYFQQNEFSTPENRYKYNGKEMVEEMGLNLHDYHARQMDPVLGRFLSVDPAAHEYVDISSYTYVLNNPIKAIDPDGRRVFFVAGANNDRDGWNYVNRWQQAFTNSGIGGFNRLDVSRGKWGDVSFTNSYRNSGTEMYQSGVNTTNYIAGLSPASNWRTKPVSNEVIDDAVGQIRNNLAANPLAEGEQLNLSGYSYGSVVQAQAALKLADAGTFVDNLILIGSPISSNSDLYRQISGHKNIGKVLRFDITGDKLSNPKDILEFINGAFQNREDTGPHFDLARPGANVDKAIKSVTEWLKSNGVK